MRLLLATILIFAIFAKSSLAKYSSSDDVVELNPSNFDKLVNDDSIWIIKFYAEWCGHCQSLEPEYKKAATALKGIIKVGAVNADEHKSLGGRFSIQGFPTIKIFGVTKNAPTDLEYSSRTAKGIAEAALVAAKKRVSSILGGSSSSSSSGSSSSDDVIELTDTNFDKLVLNSDDVWLVEFMAPWCGHCKNLAPHWSKAASELKGKVKLGVLDATAHQSKAQEYGVRGYPTIKFFPGGKKSKNDAEDFNGGRTSADIVTFALEKYADNIPAPELIEITGEDAFNQACEGKPLCVVSVLPHILDCNAKCRNEFLGILRELADKFKKKSWGWVWSEGGAQAALEESLEIGGFGYPAMTLVNFKKMKFSILKGSFSKDGLNEFLRDISYGRGQTAPVRGAVKPNINKVEAWDGKDGQLPEEEEIDLSDVDLDEKIEL